MTGLSGEKEERTKEKIGCTYVCCVYVTILVFVPLLAREKPLINR